MDELTGVQALERKHLYLPPMLPGDVLRREFESLRHGPLCWYIHLEVATGQILEPSSGPTRDEQDCVAHLRRLGDSAPDVKRCHLMSDHVDTHRALALVRWKADLEGIEQETDAATKARTASCVRWLAVQPSCTIPRIAWCCMTRPSTPAFMKKARNLARVSRSRTLLKRGTFTSLENVRDQILACIDDSNRTMAKPTKWTFWGIVCLVRYLLPWGGSVSIPGFCGRMW